MGITGTDWRRLWSSDLEGGPQESCISRSPKSALEKPDFSHLNNEPTTQDQHPSTLSSALL